MTTTIDPAILQALEAAPVPYDLYREVHKGLRHALFGLVVEIGAADGADPTDREHAVDRVHDTLELLHAHHEHEDQFVKPLVDAADPRLGALVDAGHVETDAALLDIALLADRLSVATGAQAVAVGLELYHRVTRFVATYLEHMALEEGEVMAALRQAMSVGALFEVDMALRASIPVESLCRFVAVMVPAMNPDERAAMVGGLRAGAPAEVFEQVRAVVEAALDPRDYAVVATRVGLA